MTQNGHVEEFRQIAGARIQLLRGGQGPPLVFLHGAAGAGLWLPFLESLARRFTVYAPSHPGFGRSDDPEWLEGMDDLVHFYLDFLDELDHPRVHLVGLSLGGWIAAELATVCSHRLGRLVLVDAAGIRVDGVSVPDLFIMPPDEAVRTIFGNPAAAAAIYPAEPTPEQLEILLRQRITVARLAWNPYFHNPKLPRRLRRVRVPTLVVWGQEDRLFPLEHARAFQQAIGGARLVVLPGCGHVPPLDRPEEFVRAVTAFLEET